MKLELENGLHPVHDHSNATKRAANIKWFEQMWSLTTNCGSDKLLTDFCCYVRTDKGFRRLVTESDHDEVIAADELQTATDPETIEKD